MTIEEIIQVKPSVYQIISSAVLGDVQREIVSQLRQKYNHPWGYPCIYGRNPDKENFSYAVLVGGFSFSVADKSACATYSLHRVDSKIILLEHHRQEDFPAFHDLLKQRNQKERNN